MPEISPTVEGLLSQVERLDDRSLRTFLARANSIRVRRHIPEKERREKILLKKIYEGFALDKIKRIRALQEKLQAESLSDAEHKELILLVNQADSFDVRRLKLLIELSKLRATQVPKLMADLGLKPAQL